MAQAEVANEVIIRPSGSLVVIIQATFYIQRLHDSVPLATFYDCTIELLTKIAMVELSM
jgi:hypothetical protein